MSIESKETEREREERGGGRVRLLCIFATSYGSVPPKRFFILRRNMFNPCTFSHGEKLKLFLYDRVFSRGIASCVRFRITH